MRRETISDVIETQPQPAYTHPAPANQATAPEAWTIVIRPQRNLFDLRLGELWQARGLVKLFVWRDFVAGYKGTILGPLWYLIQPRLTTLTFIWQGLRQESHVRFQQSAKAGSAVRS